jgi:hypothetical protein
MLVEAAGPLYSQVSLLSVYLSAFTPPRRRPACAANRSCTRFGGATLPWTAAAAAGTEEEEGRRRGGERDRSPWSRTRVSHGAADSRSCGAVLGLRDVLPAHCCSSCQAHPGELGHPAMQVV